MTDAPGSETGDYEPDDDGSEGVTTVRISGPGDLLDALPRMLGFVPTNSAVLVALRPPRGRVALTMRVDLPVRRHETSCARLLAGHAQRAGATSAVLVIYDDRPPPVGRKMAGCVPDTRDARGAAQPRRAATR